MHELVIAPFLDDFYVLRPGRNGGLKIPYRKYAELRQAVAAGLPVPGWLARAAREAWQLDLSERQAAGVLLARSVSPLAYGRASYELNLGCNYDCKMCYLGLKKFEGLAWDDRVLVLEAMRNAGVVWCQLTGGEPMIDRLFVPVYEHAWDLGMMLDVLTNGSRLASPLVLDSLTKRRPHKVTLSLYGATADTYDGLTQRRGAFRRFMRGLRAAIEAELPLDLSLIITKDNVHEVEQMQGLADRFGLRYREYSAISPTIRGGAESLPSQSPEYLTNRRPFTGCDAGHTSFHVDPLGRASICKIGREPNILLHIEGADGLKRLGAIADQLLKRQGGCTGCTLAGNCATCMPLAALYRKAQAPLATYCQHRERSPNAG
ncbi:radical SAM protein [Actinomadura rupiterrae]|uniref:radical SAM protein n=1 Tax=Actinomadura rupiterrae TaxID=559627 RepID=UPI0020A4AD7B|nr:radical SAM protein [Actinomadura rupiterrae]MCP2337385.1 MoaA/NifB/PqqE/SkfB family radical SAM enzyme [Actinomadura rupiterrae]